ncbi:MAG: amidophosphoribosyltransferase [Candidatus Ratteibacteria bacterium]|nr:amidophosphoribosyltransferase [Candidatus Ratteibacteria bacterium]
MSGIFGVINKKNDCAETLFYGTDYHSHLGTEYGGMAVFGKKFTRQIRNLTQTQFKSKFFQDYKKMRGNKGIGVISDFDEQPIYLGSKLGPFCIVTNGLIKNSKELMKKLLKEGTSFSEVSKDTVNVTELAAKLISEGNDFVDGIEKLFDAIDGSCSLLLLNKDGIYAARDRLGYTPLVVGKSDNSWAITTETSAFPNLGFEITKYVRPGEIVLINESGMYEKKPGNQANQICSFLWIYTGFPASSYEGINVEIARENSGMALAKADKNLEADMVAGIPDSGIAHAIGYAIQSGKPYRRPLVKYTPGYGRSYIPPSQQTRDLIAKMKLIPIKEIIKGKKIVICEDSIVRGTQLKNFTVKKLMDCGAKEVHIRPACPPLLFPCKFNLSTKRINELAARKAIRALEGKDIKNISKYLDSSSREYKKMVDWIAKDLGVTTIRYQTINDMIKAIGLPQEKLCLHCWTGNPKE